MFPLPTPGGLAVGSPCLSWAEVGSRLFKARADPHPDEPHRLRPVGKAAVTSVDAESPNPNSCFQLADSSVQGAGAAGPSPACVM